MRIFFPGRHFYHQGLWTGDHTSQAERPLIGASHDKDLIAELIQHKPRGFKRRAA